MRSYQYLSTAIVTLFVLWAACSSAPKGITVTGTPTGFADANPVIEITFSEPMVAEPDVGKPAFGDAQVVIEPSLAGELKWSAPNRLRFDARERFKRNTAYNVTVPAGMKGTSGKKTASPYRFAFHTEGLGVEARFENSARRYASGRQRIHLWFTDPVQAADVAKHCAFVGPGNVAVTVDSNDTEGEAGTDGQVTGQPVATRSVSVVPAADLAMASSWALTCSTKLISESAGFGFVTERRIAFQTLGPFRVVGITDDGYPDADDDLKLPQPVDIDTSSLTLVLSSPLEGDLSVKLEPVVEGMTVDNFGDRAMIQVPYLAPNTSYTVVVQPGALDRFGQRLEAESRFAFTTGPEKPGLSMETGQWIVEAGNPFFVWARSVPSVDAEVTLLTEETLLKVLPELDWWDDAKLDAKKLGLSPVAAKIPVASPTARYEAVHMDLAKAVGNPNPTGMYYVAIKEPAPDGSVREREVLLNTTDLGVTVKLSQATGLAWVTRLSTGGMVANASISVRLADGTSLWQGQTDARGIATLPGRAKLLPTKPAGAAADDATAAASDDESGDEGFEGEDGEGEWGDGDATPRVLVFAREGNDMTFVDPDQEGGFAYWNYNVQYQRAPKEVQLRGFLHTDRGLYRPGETVSIRGLARTMRLASGLTVPTSKASVRVSNPDGEVIFQRDVKLSRFGGFSVDVPLETAARLGDYTVVANLPEGNFRDSFSVEEYRPAAFEVTSRARATSTKKLQTISTDVTSTYFYGAPVRKGDVTYSVQRRLREPSFAQFSDFDFGDDSVDARTFGWGYETVMDGDGTLDKSGRAKWQMPIEAERRFDYDYVIQATVKDESNQAISSRASVTVPRAAFSLGIRRSARVTAANEKARFAVVAVDEAGRRVAAKASAKVERIEWNCAWEQGGYRGAYYCSEKATEVGNKTLAIAPLGDAFVETVADKAGRYRVTVEAADAMGRTTRSATSVWTYSEADDDDGAAWRASDGSSFDIIADKPVYKPGDTARLVLQTPTKGVTALVTVERDGVLDAKVVQFEKMGAVVNVPIKDSHGPNVYVSVAIMKGRKGPGAKGLPTLKMGLLNVPVAVEAKRQLKITVTTAKSDVRPGELVTAQLAVTDAAGKPVSAEIALAAADEGVLSLIGFQTPNPLSTFYAEWGLGVSTASQVERLVQIPDAKQMRSTEGGDAVGKLGTLRSRLVSTAYWNPAVVTDASGRATVTFNAPDNLTAFRLMAVGADAKDRFGAGDARFTVSKPVQVNAAMPRFFLRGDQANGAVVIHNETDQPGKAVVRAVVTGATLTGPAEQTVDVPAKSRAVVSFPISAAAVGNAVLSFAVDLGTEHDGLQITLPVQAETPAEKNVLANGFSSGQTMPITLPEGTLAGSATLSVAVDVTGLAAARESLRDLIAYPYGCLEQTTSKLIPLITVGELGQSLALPELADEKQKAFVAAGIARLATFQTWNGGFSLWPGGDSPEAYLTATALWTYKVAQDAGVVVPAERMERAAKYLIESLDATPRTDGVYSEMGDLGSRAFALYVLGSVGKLQAGAVAKLIEQKDKLPRFGLALLIRAAAQLYGAKDAKVAALVNDLAGFATVKGNSASMKEGVPAALYYYMSDDARTTAMTLGTLLEVARDHALVRPLANGLLAVQQGGVWYSTQSNLWALVTLAAYAKQAAGQTRTVRLTQGGKTIFEKQVVGAALATLELPVEPDAKEVAVTITGGDAYVSSVLRYRRDRAHQTPVSAGVTLERAVLHPETNAPLADVREGDLVKVRVRFTLAKTATHLAVADYLPAGFEPVQGRFVTSEQAPSEDAGRKRSEFQPVWGGHKEMRDDRVALFFEWLSAGKWEFSYFARATTAGTFLHPGVVAEEMYRSSEVFARTAATDVVVLSK